MHKAAVVPNACVIGILLGRLVCVCLVSMLGTHTVWAAQLPEDPLGSVMWKNMAQRFFPGEIVFDQRVKVLAPRSAEDQFHVPITVDATDLTDVEEIVAVADLNPIPHILTLRPKSADAFIGFRVKLEQTTPIRVGVKTADGVWHMNAVEVDAAGGGCTAPAAAHGQKNWIKTLGHTRAIARRENTHTARLSFRMNHPMDTGLAAGIPVFYMETMLVKNAGGDVLAEVELYEPVSENPTLTLKPNVGEGATEVQVFARDTEGHEFEFPLAVPPNPSN